MAWSASDSTEARLMSAGHFGSVALATTSGGIFVYVPITWRASSGFPSA
jgi:hypothetical protein